MKTLCFAIVISLGAASAAALHAQTTTEPNAKPVTVTGCVEPSTPQTPTGTSGVTGAIAPDTKFVLTTPAAATPGGTASRTHTSPAAVEYRLDDADLPKVSPFQGQKVAITGTVEEPTAPAASDSNKGTSAPRLRVSSIKRVSAVCSW